MMFNFASGPWIAQAIYDVAAQPGARIKRVVKSRGLVSARQARPGEAFVLLDDPDIDTSLFRITDDVLVPFEP